MTISLLTATLEFVSITRSSTEVPSLVAETFASSFSGSSWKQIIVKKFAQSDLMLKRSMLTLDFVSMTLNFQHISRGHQEKHPDDIDDSSW